MTWSVNLGIGARPPQSLLDPASSPLAALARLLEPFAYRSSPREALVGSPTEDEGVRRLLAVLDEVDATELERVREDCRRSRGLPRGAISSFYSVADAAKADVRAVFLPGLVALRRSPDHQGSLATALGISEPAQ
jgi:hypothetical protein